jgi:hypothetical protein
VYIIPGSGHPSEPSFQTTDSARTITQLLAIHLGQRGSLLQDWIEDCLRHLSFRVSVCLRSFGPATTA